MKKKIIAGIISLLMIFMPFDHMNAMELPKEGTEETEAVNAGEAEAITGIHAQAALLMDAETGRVLYEKNGYTPKAMASTTKIMTCIIALEKGNPLDVVTISSNAAGQPKVRLGIQKEEQFQLGDLLYSLMLESHNDVAVAIAEHVGGSVEGFAVLMNEKAVELGCKETNFVTPNGLDAEGHQTTAEELALITRYAIQNEEFVKITNTPSYSFANIAATRTFQVNNKDQFLHQMEGAFGVKTGFTGEAGYCFVGALKRGDKTFISVVLGSGWPPDKTWKWADTKALMTYGLDNYEKKQVFDSEKVIEPVEVVDGQEKLEELLYPEEDLTLLMRNDEKIEIVYELPDKLQAPVTKGQIAGSAKYYIGERLFKEIPIYTAKDIAKIDYKYCFMELWKLFSF
jgi:D-alanyl-D-alanine carboxypeptidase (penicillin-binding protein 5/6)